MSATIHQASVHEDGSFTIVARLTQSNPARTPLVQANISEMKYWIRDESTRQYVSGHEGEELTVASVIFDTLQVWTDRPQSPGYNFLATFPADSIPDGRRVYRLELKTTLTNGQVGWDKWDLHAIETSPS